MNKPKVGEIYQYAGNLEYIIAVDNRLVKIINDFSNDINPIQDAIEHVMNNKIYNLYTTMFREETNE